MHIIGKNDVAELKVRIRRYIDATKRNLTACLDYLSYVEIIDNSPFGNYGANQDNGNYLEFRVMTIVKRDLLQNLVKAYGFLIRFAGKT